MNKNNLNKLPSENTGLSTRHYVLFMLTSVYVFNFIDRQILAILQEPIKADLNLTDTHLGLLTGLAFAALYVTLSIPIAYYADKNNRKNIIAISLGFWSLMTVFTGMAQNFIQILLARIGVGVGEAGGTPPAHSIICDYYEPEKRATALSIYSMGVYIGVCVGFIVGGILAHHYGWRVALYALGVPGVLFAVIVYFTVKEPVKGAMDNQSGEQKSINTKEALKILRSNKTFIFISLATGFHSFGMYAAGSWLPSFFIRSHGMDLQTLGITLGLITALFGGLGAFGGGFITDKLRKKDMRWYLWLPLLTTILVIPLVIVIFFAKSLSLVLIFLALYYLITAMYIGPSVSVVQSLFPAEMRAFASSIFLFILNSIGLGLGPLTVGIVSDYLEPTLGEDALRWAFTVTFIATIIAGFLFNIASKSYKKDLAVSTKA